jgi:hypothetical protein
LDPLNRAQAIEQLFGKFQFSRLSTLFQNVIKEGNQASRVLKLANSTTEELAILAERELKKVEDSPMFKFQKAIEDIKVTLVPLGEAFLKAVTPVLEFGTKILEKFNELDAGAKSFVVGLTAVAGVIGPVFLMGFGLIANGVANVIKMFTFFKTALNKAGTASTELGMQTDYMTAQQLEASAVAASLDQVHQKLIQTFTSEAAAINNLTAAYNKTLTAQSAISGGAIRRTRPTAKYASGVMSVPGPKGAGDIVPAMLAPGEAVIPAKQAKKYAPFIQDMISGNIPGFRNGVFLGMPKSAKAVTKSRSAADEIYEMFKKSSYANTPPTTYGHQISPTSGHSFPIFGLGGVYQKGNKQVFVKPVMDEKAAIAELRATTIARQAHGLKSPNQRIVVMRDPMDVKRQRKFLALESDLDPTFVNNQPLGMFNEEQYFKQLTASLLRGDKDLSASNVYKDVLADVGPAGVFDRASGLRDYSKKMISMEEQALINLLGVKGGAKRAFAESTLGLMNNLTPQQYHQKMIGEIQRVLPKLKQTIASFKLTNPTDVGMYDDMVRRLEAGLNVDWSKFHSIHSAVKIPKPKVVEPTGYAKGVVSVPGPKGAGDIMPAMLSPGEAVIPTKLAKKYAPLINGIIADNIPGFVIGKKAKPVGAHLSRPMAHTPEVYSQVENGIPGFSQLPVEIRSLVDILTDLTSEKTPFLNNQAKGAGMGPEQFEAEWNKNPDGLRATIRRAESAGEMIVDQANDSIVDGMDAEIGRRTKSKILTSKIDKTKMGWLDDLITESTAEVLEEGLASADPKVRNVAQGLQARKNRVGTVRTRLGGFDESGNKITEGQALKDLEARGLAGRKNLDLFAVNPDGSNSKLKLGRPAYDYSDKSPEGRAARRKSKADALAALARGEDPNIRMRGSSAPAGAFKNQPGGTYEAPETAKHKKARLAAAALAGETDADAYEKSRSKNLKGSDPYLEATTRTSPHKKAAIDGRDDAKAYSKAKREQLTKEEKYVRNLQSNYSGAQVVTSQMRGERKQVEKLMKQDRVVASQAKQRAIKIANQQRMASQSNQDIYGTTDFNPQMRQERKRQQAADKASRVKAASERKILAREKATAAQAKRQASAGPQSAATAPRQRKPGMGMGGMAMVASGAVMAGSMMPGPIGKMSQDLMMPVMMASMILPMLKGPVAIAIAALAGLAVAGFALKGAFDKAQDESMKLAEAMGSSEKSIKDYAEFSGKVSAGEIMDRRRADDLSPFTTKTGKTTYGEAFMQSEQGQAKAGAIRQSISVAGKAATENQLINQLVTAVSSGALDSGQARSIVANLATEIGDASFGVSVNAKLVELLGPNGENLINDPLLIRVKLAEDTRQQTVTAGQNMAKVKDPLQELGRASLQTGALAATGAMVGAAITGPLAPVGAAVGAVAGTVAGIALNAGSVVDSFNKMGTASGAVVASGILALQQQQEMLDSLDLEYETRKAAAIAAGDVEKAEKLTTDHILARKALLEENVKTTAAVLENYSKAGFVGQGAMGQAVDKAIEQRYKDDPIMQPLAIAARDQIVSASGLDQTQEYQMKLLVATGDLDPLMVSQLLNNFSEDGKQLTNVLNLMTNLGSADGNKAVQLMNMFQDKDGNPLKEQQTKFIADVAAKTPAEAKKYLELFAEISKSGGLEADVILSFYNNNPKAAQQFQAMMDKINAVNGKMSMDFVQNLIGAEQFEYFKKNQAYFESLDPVQQKTYMSTFANRMQLEGDPDMQKAYKLWLTEPGNAKKMFEEFAIAKAVQVTEATTDTSKAPAPPVDTTPTGGGAPAQSILDDIVKRLRDVRKNQIKVTNGWGESAKALENLFGGNKSISIFGGIEQDMRRLGAGEDLITLIAGMDPKEFEKQKNKLFTFNKTGEIVGFKRGLKNIGEALNSIAVGEFVNQQQRVAKEAKNQITAFNQLRAAGYSVEQAYEAIQDAAVATAIATGQLTKKELNQMLADIKKAQAEAKKLQLLTPEGMQEVFDEGFGKAMEAFEAEEKRLTLEFDVKVKDDKALVSAAENEIAKIQYQIDDYEADLKGIEDQEEKINKTYDTKLESLEKVRVANQRILEQEKGKLSVAEAITRGDLYAAAQAAQQVRETSASGYFASQSSALEAGREKALGQVRGAMGLTREQVQQKIKDLSDQIFYIEEKTLEPANERIRLAQVELDKRISEITVLGKTKGEWETIKNEIDLARVNSDAYKLAMGEALGIVTQLKDAWAGIESKEVTLTVKKVEVDGDGSGGGGGGGGSAINYEKATTKELVALTKDTKTAVKASTVIAKRAGVTIGKTTADTADKKITAYINKATSNTTGVPKGTTLRAMMKSGGGLINYMSNGGTPKFAKPEWAKTMGTDRIPAMLTPGEFVVSRPAVSKIGVQSLNSINNGEYPGSSVYNYNLSVNVSSMSDPNDIAQTVMAQIRRVESQKIRSNRF